MGLTAIAILAVAVAPPSVEVVTLQGQTSKGAFHALTAKTLTLKDAAGKPTAVPVSEVMQATFAKPAPPATKARFTVTLVDGTVLPCTQVTADSRASSATVESPALGTLKLPLAAVSVLRFGAPNPKYEKKWKELLARDNRKDRLIIAKTESLDFLPVVIDRVTEKKIHFVLSGNPLDRNRDPANFFGIIFARKKTPAKPFCNVRLAGGASLQALRIAGDGSKLTVRLLSGASIDVPPAYVAKLDFSLGKVRYLSDLEPRSVEFTPYFDDKFTRSLFRYRKDKAFAGKLTLGKTVFARGLWIHSRTLLKYRIAGEYRRFRAVMGIDHAVAKEGKGHVYVTFSGDGKTLFEGHVRGADAPRKLDLDVAGVRDLEILVDYGDNDGTADHLDLGDARVIK
ncbi:MAG: NPCBM/NEW2 domain-containing protein [Planctomycetaceae bacterium]